MRWRRSILFGVPASEITVHCDRVLCSSDETEDAWGRLRDLDDDGTLTALWLVSLGSDPRTTLSALLV